MPAVRSSPGAKKRPIKTCDTCRARKVRCIRDADNPCNKCMEGNLPCVYTGSQSSPVARSSPYTPRGETLSGSSPTGSFTVASRPSRNFETTKSSEPRWRPALYVPGKGPLNILRDTHNNRSESPPEHRRRVFTDDNEQSAPPIAVGTTDASESNTPSVNGPTYPVGTTALPITEDEQSEPPVVVGTSEAPEFNTSSDNGPTYRLGTAVVTITKDDQILLKRASKLRSCNEQIRALNGKLSKEKSDEVEEFEKRYSIAMAELEEQQRRVDQISKAVQDVSEELRNVVERDKNDRKALEERLIKLKGEQDNLRIEMMEPFTLEQNTKSTNAEGSANTAITT